MKLSELFQQRQRNIADGEILKLLRRHVDYIMQRACAMEDAKRLEEKADLEARAQEYCEVMNLIEGRLTKRRSGK